MESSTQNMLIQIKSTDPFSIEVLNHNFAVASASGGIPSGGIIAWSGNETNIPEGYALCDGTNGTPDLRDRFILGANSNHAIGSIGGEETHLLTKSEMPAHSHSTYYGTDSMGRYPYKESGNGSTSSLGLSTSSVGDNQPHNNMPPYYALCYIMKL